MGMRGTVRRSTDPWFVHCNVDTDVMVWEGDANGTSPSPSPFPIADSLSRQTTNLNLPNSNLSSRTSVKARAASTFSAHRIPSAAAGSPSAPPSPLSTHCEHLPPPSSSLWKERKPRGAQSPTPATSSRRDSHAQATAARHRSTSEQWTLQSPHIPLHPARLPKFQHFYPTSKVHSLLSPHPLPQRAETPLPQNSTPSALNPHHSETASPPPAASVAVEVQASA